MIVSFLVSWFFIVWVFLGWLALLVANLLFKICNLLLDAPLDVRAVVVALGFLEFFLFFFELGL